MFHPFVVTLDRVEVFKRINTGLCTGCDQAAGSSPNIERFAKKAWSAISYDWDLDSESETARFYLQHHLDEFSVEEVIKLFGSSVVDKSIFFSALSLVRIGLYPEDDEMFSVFDIQFPQELTDYLMSVSIGSDGQITGINFES